MLASSPFANTELLFLEVHCLVTNMSSTTWPSMENKETALLFQKVRGVTSYKQHTATISTHAMLLLLSLELNIITCIAKCIPPTLSMVAFWL